MPSKPIFYLSGSNDQREVFVERCATFRRATKLRFKLDGDGDVLLHIAPAALESARCIAEANGLRLFKLGDE